MRHRDRTTVSDRSVHLKGKAEVVASPAAIKIEIALLSTLMVSRGGNDK